MTDGLERAHHREVTTTQLAGLNCAAVHENCRDIHTCHGQHGARHVFVAATYGKHAIHALSVAGGFDRVSDHLAAHQGILHSLGPHRDPIADGDGAKRLGHATGMTGGYLSPHGQVVQADIAGRNRAVTVGDADDRLAEILITKANSPQHGSVGRALNSLRNGVGAEHRRQPVAGE